MTMNVALIPNRYQEFVKDLRAFAHYCFDLKIKRK